MLEKQDIQLIQEIVTASEERTQAKIDASENRVMAYIEAAVMPKFQILAEGHQNILDTLAPKSRVDALEDEVVFIKSVMKAMSQEIAELKKAQ